MKYLLRRLRYKLELLRDSGGLINRRVDVENILLSAAAGKRPLPTADECRELAMRLGDPNWKKEKP